MDSSTLHQLASKMERDEIAINYVRSCYDTLVEFAELGCKLTSHMNAVKAAEQLADALDHLLGYSRNEHDFAYLRCAEPVS